MLGSIVNRGGILILGYLYPAYLCFKTLNRGRPVSIQLQFWCQYWIIVGILTVLERIADPLISWIPLYGEAKLAFIVYLWHPTTEGSTFIYNNVLLPLVTKHEPEIDQHLAELRVRSGHVVLKCLKIAMIHGQQFIIQALHFLSTQERRVNDRQETSAVPDTSLRFGQVIYTNSYLEASSSELEVDKPLSRSNSSQRVLLEEMETLQSYEASFNVLQIEDTTVDSDPIFSLPTPNQYHNYSSTDIQPENYETSVNPNRNHQMAEETVKELYTAKLRTRTRPQRLRQNRRTVETELR